MKKHFWILGLFVALLSTKAVYSNHGQTMCVKQNHLVPSFCISITDEKEIITTDLDVYERLQSELKGESQEILLYEIASQNNITLNELKAQLTK